MTSRILKLIPMPETRFQRFFLIGLIILTIINFLVLRHEIKRIHSFKLAIGHQNIGYKFAGLEPVLKDIEIMGYYTDGNLDEKAQAKLFSHAQFQLAPTILDFNNLEHEYILFVCKSEQHAWAKIKEIDAIPLNRNQFGMILVKRKP